MAQRSALRLVEQTVAHLVVRKGNWLAVLMVEMMADLSVRMSGRMLAETLAVRRDNQLVGQMAVMLEHLLVDAMAQRRVVRLVEKWVEK